VQPGHGFDLEESGAITALSTVVGLVALGAIIEVVGHELVGYRHTVRALKASDVQATG
jgi:hypothetical protein